VAVAGCREAVVVGVTAIVSVVSGVVVRGDVVAVVGTGASVAAAIGIVVGSSAIGVVFNGGSIVVASAVLVVAELKDEAELGEVTASVAVAVVTALSGLVAGRLSLVTGVSAATGVSVVTGVSLFVGTGASVIALLA